MFPGKYGAGLCIFLLVVPLSGCGGTGSGAGLTALPPSGSVLHTVTATASTTNSVTISDPTTGASLTIPPGSIQSGATVRLKVWSQQRGIAQGGDFYQNSPNAVDISLDPSTFPTTSSSVKVSMPFPTGTNALALLLVGFGPTGKSMVLAEDSSSSATNAVALLGPTEIRYLTGGASGVQTIEVAVENQLPVQSNPIGKPSLVHALDIDHPATSYASKMRIGVIVHGIFNYQKNLGTGLINPQTYLATTDPPMAPLLAFLKSLPTDGVATSTSPPFDSVWVFNYDFSQTIESNGQILANLINANWSDNTKYEVHIIADSMGGLVSRWALEQVVGGVPAVVQLITLGTPHRGVGYSHCFGKMLVTHYRGY